MRFQASFEMAIFFAGVTLLFLIVTADARPPRKQLLGSRNEKYDTDRYLKSIHRAKPSGIRSWFASASTNNAKLDQSPNKSESAAKKVLSSSTSIDEEPTESRWPGIASPQLYNLLSPDTFAQVDPFEYLLRKSTQLKLTVLLEIKNELHSLLTSNRVPQRYIPYARTLQSILQCQYLLLPAKRNIKEIQAGRDENWPENDFSEFSLSSELVDSGLFSSDVFSDPDPPLRLYHKLLNISITSIPNIKIQLDNFRGPSKEMKWRYCSPGTWWSCIYYAQTVASFLYDDSALDDLKREKVEIQRISTSEQSSSK